MKILVVGGGGREHAIIRALKKSPEMCIRDSGCTGGGMHTVFQHGVMVHNGTGIDDAPCPHFGSCAHKGKWQHHSPDVYKRQELHRGG